ncbi:2-hydroxy-3-oxopropionate reductase [Bordetella bronchialis]|uniref:2-hydroxy-3-oxopropionate reductase n=1 Tax=Bordetella bronchialis TaxID=463025 RepID=A0A193FZB7_9BORD|nr:2-hydroxy-3-oxopropionate reductase [Bordetella bronchialis]ANN72334.1 2-hydroxy-3-oxopropionate reductase [Bordetella bronchialis]
MNIGFVGLGIMGRPMALNLAAAGHALVVCGQRTVPPDIRETGATVVDSLADVARKAEIVILMVPDTQDVEDVLFAQAGIAAGLEAGKLVIDMSSISPIETREFARRVNELGCDYLDAPVSGGEIGARTASLTIMAGGPPAAFERALPLFEKLGKNITLVGGNGDGQTTKVANQIIVALTIAAVGEALLFAAKAGADPARVRAALMGGFAASRVLEVHGERMVKRNFEPGFRIDLHHKDLGLALRGADALGLSLPNTAMTQQLFNAARAAGAGNLDHAGVVRVLETLCGHRIA